MQRVLVRAAACTRQPSCTVSVYCQSLHCTAVLMCTDALMTLRVVVILYVYACDKMMHTAANGHEGVVELWDTTYWAERQKEQLYAFSEEELRPYFPLPKVYLYDTSFTILYTLHL